MFPPFLLLATTTMYQYIQPAGVAPPGQDGTPSLWRAEWPPGRATLILPLNIPGPPYTRSPGYINAGCEGGGRS